LRGSGRPGLSPKHINLLYIFFLLQTPAHNTQTPQGQKKGKEKKSKTEKCQHVQALGTNDKRLAISKLTLRRVEILGDRVEISQKPKGIRKLMPKKKNNGNFAPFINEMNPPSSKNVLRKQSTPIK